MHSTASMLSKMSFDRLNSVNLTHYEEVLGFLSHTETNKDSLDTAIQLLADRFNLQNLCYFLSQISTKKIIEYKHEIEKLVNIFFSSSVKIKCHFQLPIERKTAADEFWYVFDRLHFGEYFSGLENFVDICMRDQDFWKKIFFNFANFERLFETKYKIEKIKPIIDRLLTAVCSDKDYLHTTFNFSVASIFSFAKKLFENGYHEHAQRFFQLINDEKMLLGIFDRCPLNLILPDFAKDKKLPKAFIDNISQMLKFIISSPELNCNILKDETTTIQTLKKAGYHEEAILLREINKSPEMIEFKKVKKWQEEIQKSNDEAAKKTETRTKTNQNDNFEDELIYSDQEDENDEEYFEEEDDHEETSDNDNSLSK